MKLRLSTGVQFSSVQLELLFCFSSPSLFCDFDELAVVLSFFFFFPSHCHFWIKNFSSIFRHSFSCPCQFLFSPVLFSEPSTFSLTSQRQSSAVAVSFRCFLKVNFAFMLNLFVPSPYILYFSLLSDRQLIVNQCHLSRLSHLLPIDLQISRSAPALGHTALDG